MDLEPAIGHGAATAVGAYSGELDETEEMDEAAEEGAAETAAKEVGAAEAEAEAEDLMEDVMNDEGDGTHEAQPTEALEDAWALAQLSAALGADSQLHAQGEKLRSPEYRPITYVSPTDRRRARAEGRPSAVVASDATLYRSFLGGCVASGVLYRWRRSDVTVRALEALCAAPATAPDGDVTERALEALGAAPATAPEGEHAPATAPIGEQCRRLSLALHLVPCARQGLLVTQHLPLASLLTLAAIEHPMLETSPSQTPPAAADGSDYDPNYDPSPAPPQSSPQRSLARALRDCVRPNAGGASRLIRVRLPLLMLRLLAHGSQERALLEAVLAHTPSEILMATAAHWRAHDESTATAVLATQAPSRMSVHVQEVMARLWGGVLGGAVVPPALHEPDHDQLMEAMLHGALERSGVDSDVQLVDAAGIGVDACDQALAPRPAGELAVPSRPAGQLAVISSLLAAFPGVLEYHSRLIREARDNSGRVRTLGGRYHVASLRAAPCERERAAAEAALLGDACRACAADVTTALLAKLTPRIAGGVGPGSAPCCYHPVLLLHCHDELLFELVPQSGCVQSATAQDVAQSRMQNAMDASIEEVTKLLHLSVRLHVELEVLV